jgi:F-type H+-transporting ATPase subunit delta
MESVIAEKYAVALLQAAQAQKNVDSVTKELRLVSNLLGTHPDLKSLVEHPRMKAEEKLDSLRGFMEQKLSQTMENFLKLLITKKRIKHFQAVADRYEILCYEISGKTIARVLTAMPLTVAQRESMIKKLSQMIGLTVELREEVRPGLIGGMMIYMGDQRMDGSVLGQLEKMKQRMMSVEIE